MLGSLVVYLGVVVALVGLLLTIRPIPRLGIRTRPQALLLAAAGVTVAVVGLVLPAGESRVTTVESRLDEFVPVWQFNERHSIRVAAPPDLVFEAIRQVRADEVALLRTLTWIRRGGRETPEGMLNPGNQKPLLDVALSSGFSLLAEDAPREVVIGTVPIAGTFAAMNFAVRPQGSNRSILTTETRVFASTASATRRFGAYWRLIYPGSALIRRMWLRAIKARAMREYL
jgi:hypothetical protein